MPCVIRTLLLVSVIVVRLSARACCSGCSNDCVAAVILSPPCRQDGLQRRRIYWVWKEGVGAACLNAAVASDVRTCHVHVGSSHISRVVHVSGPRLVTVRSPRGTRHTIRAYGRGQP